MDNRKVHLIGNAHLDPVWLWRWGEGANEVLQTFRSALDRLNEFPGFIFTCSSARYYKWVEETDPAMFEEIRARVREGRWLPVGGWAVQPDCNMPSGESFARHALYSQLYYYEKFGKICRVGYNPDSFGHAASLPKLLNAGGMFSYAFQRPEPRENAKIPPLAFQWRGDDGNRVLAWHIPESYTCSGTEALDRRADALLKESEARDYPMMLFFGVGNHGGGPTKGDLAHLVETYRADSPDADVVFSEPDTYFREVAAAMPDLPVWDGELQHHASGCYSAMSRVKALNSRAEDALYAAEVWDTIASRVSGCAPQTERLARAWEQVLFCQFHDSLCGCSVREAYDDIEAFYGHAIGEAEQIRAMALLKLTERVDTAVPGVGDAVTRRERHLGAPTGKPRPVVVFNPASFPVKKAVRVSYPAKSVTDAEGNALPFQLVRASRSNDSHTDTLFEAEVPAFGYRLYFVTDTEYDYHGKYAEPEKATAPVILENGLVRASFDPAGGFITVLKDKRTGETLTGSIDVPTVIRDDKTDTWAHNVFRFDGDREAMRCEGVFPVENGPVRQVVRVKYGYRDSYLSRDYILESGSDVIEVVCRANWREPFTVLKTVSAPEGTAPDSAAGIPAGFIRRAATGDEEPMQRWCGVSVARDGKRAGLCVLTDGKYSYDCNRNALGVTLLRNVIFADHYSDRPYADFDFTDEGLHRFRYGLYVHGGETDPGEAAKRAFALKLPPEAVQAGYHPGPLGPAGQAVRTEAENVQASALKFCEDGSGDVIVRLWETAGKANTLAVCMSDLFDFGFRFEIGAGEVKTFRVTPGGRVREINFLEGIPAPETDAETIAEPPYGNYDREDA